MAVQAPARPRRGSHIGDFTAKTLAGMAEALERALFSEERARLPGLLQCSDPRAKVVATVLLLVSLGLLRHVALVVVLYALVIVLAAASRIPIAFFLKRTWLGIPLFAALVALPAAFTMPGQPLLTLLDLSGWRLALTDAGLAGAVLFIARVGCSVSLAILLVLTTRWADLLKALRVLRVPESFVIVLGMTYRYLFLLLHLANDLFLARRSRSVGPVSAGEQRRWMASTTGALFGKSLKMSADVHQAMVARGFTGQLRTLNHFRMSDVDYLLVALALLSASLLLLIDRGLA